MTVRQCLTKCQAVPLQDSTARRSFSIHKTNRSETEITWNPAGSASLFGAGNAIHQEMSMTNRYLISVAAAALIAGAGLANAQAPNREAPSSGAATQQNSPSSAAPAIRDSSQSGALSDSAKSSQSKDMAPKGEKSAQHNMRGEKAPA